MKAILFITFMTAIIASGCLSQDHPYNENDKIILISTEYGDITIKLYNETPKHRDNFIKLVKEGFFDECLFHRVIKDFMIQGGDPDSKNATPGSLLGNGGPGYTIEAEFVDTLIHKKGVLAAARESDNVNPEKRSSGSQFYIVQGKVFTNAELVMIEQQMNKGKQNELIMQYIMRQENVELKQKIDSLNRKKDIEALKQIERELIELTKSDMDKTSPFKFTDQQRKIYTTTGGSPHLDGSYTVFGEVLSGFEVIDKIAAVQTDRNARPNQDIKMNITVVNE